MNDKKQQWYNRIFSKNLIKCDSNEYNNQSTSTSTSLSSLSTLSVPTEDILKNVEITGIYFSFANINVQNDDFLKKLHDLYEKLNNNHHHHHHQNHQNHQNHYYYYDNKNNDETVNSHFNGKTLEIIQVVMWAHNDNYDSDFESSHRENLLGLPWYAMAFNETNLKTKLSRRYRIKSGVPTLILLDKDGKTVSVSAHERLIDDPNGINFPWRPRPIDEILKDVILQVGGAYYQHHSTTYNQCSDNNLKYRDLSDGIRGFYFSANWCPPCRTFTPQLATIYKQIRKKEPNFEIIFISSDRSIESYRNYIETMPWLSVPFQHNSVRTELAQLYGIRGIPTLLLLDSNGHVITMDARAELIEDPLAQNFPWKPRAVNALTDRFLTKLHDYPAVVLFVDNEETELQFAETVLNSVANNYYKENNINFSSVFEDRLFSTCDHDDDYYLQFLYADADSESSDLLRDLIGLDDVVPLLVVIDIPNRRYAIMEYGIEINLESVNNFVEKFQNGNLKFRIITTDEEEDGDVVGHDENDRNLH